MRARWRAAIEEALKTSEIEGEHLDPNAVRSSVARRLGLPTAGMVSIKNQQADGVVQILLDATQNFNQKLISERVFGWHAALFPTGYSGMHKINVASWRDDSDGPMRVVSGPIGREKIHYEAPPAEGLADEQISRVYHQRTRGYNRLDGMVFRMHVQSFSELKQTPGQCIVKGPVLEALRSD